jgi:hypothetical protein
MHRLPTPLVWSIVGHQDLQSTTAKHIRAMENVTEVHVFADLSTQLPQYQIRRQWSDLLPQHTVVMHAWLFADTLQQVVAEQERKVREQHASKSVLTPPQPLCVVFDSNLERTCWLDYPGDKAGAAAMTRLVNHAKSLNISFFTCHHSAIHPWLPVDVLSVSSCVSDDTVLQDVFDRTQWYKKEALGPFRKRFPSSVCMPFLRSKLHDAPDWYVMTLQDHQVYRENTANRVLYLRGLWVPRPAIVDSEVVVVAHPGLVEAGMMVGEPSTIVDGMTASSSSSSSSSNPFVASPSGGGDNSADAEAARAMVQWASQSFVELCMEDNEGHPIVTEEEDSPEPHKAPPGTAAMESSVTAANPLVAVAATVLVDPPSPTRPTQLPCKSEPPQESPSPEVVNSSPVPTEEPCEPCEPCNESPVPPSPMIDDVDDVLFPPTPPSTPASPVAPVDPVTDSVCHAVVPDGGTVILLGSDHDEEHLDISPPPMPSATASGLSTSNGGTDAATDRTVVPTAATTTRWWPGSWLGSWSEASPPPSVPPPPPQQ